MFKSFSNLNDALKNTRKAKITFNVERVIQAGRNILDIASNLSAKYSRMYSQVQWMKYDDQGSPSDVTPSEQDSAAISIISDAKNQLSSELNSYDSSSSIHVTQSVTNVTTLLRATGPTRSYDAELVLVGGAIKLKVNTTGAALGNSYITYFGNPATGVTIQQRDSADNLKGTLTSTNGRIIGGLSFAPDGKPVFWSSWPQSGSPALICFCITYSGSCYRFYLEDRAYSQEVVDSFGSAVILGSDDFYVRNQTEIDFSVIYTQFIARGATVAADDKFILAGGTVARVNKWDALFRSIPPTLSTEVSADLSVTVNDLYPGINEVISKIQGL